MFSWLCPCKVHCLRFCEHFISGERWENNRHKVGSSFYSIWPPTVFFDSSLSCFPTVQLQPLWWIAIVFLLISKLPCHSPEWKTYLSQNWKKKEKEKKKTIVWHFKIDSGTTFFFSPSDNWICGLEGGQGHAGELIVNWKVISQVDQSQCVRHHGRLEVSDSCFF